MLEYYVQSTRCLERLRGIPLGEHTDALATKLQARGFTQATGRRILGLTGKLNEFAHGARIEAAAGVDEGLVKRFIDEELRARGTYRDAESLLRHMVEYLRAVGVVGRHAVGRPEDAFASLLARYDSHLATVRGLSASSREQYLAYARRFLSWYHERHGEQPLALVSGVDVLDYVTQLAGLHASGSWRHNLCSLTRSFLRYLRWEGIVEVDLDRVVPTLPQWRLQSIPRHLPGEQVQTLLDSVDTSTSLGLRDKAVLLCIATLGLRNKEVRELELGAVRWRAGEIRLAETKSRRERALPLPPEVGAAMADYVLNGRPQIAVPQVFLRHRAPQGPITSSGGIVGIVRKHLLRAGIDAPSHGAHLLRHSLATRLVNEGVAIKRIADLLGHASIDTTAIYTKVDRRRLSDVALPFPGGDA